MSGGALSFALVGAGRIGIMHAQLIAAHPRATLAAVHDANADAARAATESFGGSPVADVDAAILAADAVLIASPTDTHCDYMERAARAGKPVLCEKPIHLDTARTDACRETLSKIPASVVQMGFNRRFDPGHAALRARVAAGEIGKLEKLIITSRDIALPSDEYLAACGGLFYDMMIHDFDMARFILDEEPARIFATGASLVAPDGVGGIDTAMAILQTPSGALCHINCSRRSVYGYDQRVEAFGEKGMLISGNPTANEVTAHNAKATSARGPLLHFFIERYADSFRLQLDAFIDAAASGTAPSPAFEDGRRALILAKAAEQSRREGCWAALEF